MSDGGDTETGGDTDFDASDTYLVEIKRSARRRSAAAGEHVRHMGRYRRFASKALAREWAREASMPGDRVWIQDALPAHSNRADGYLVGGHRSGGARRQAAGGSQTSIDASADASE